MASGSLRADLSSSSEVDSENEKEDPLSDAEEASESGPSSSEEETSNDEVHPQTETENNLKSDLSFQELLALREKLGSKAFDKKFVRNEQLKQDSVMGSKFTSYARKNKNRPQEISSKKPVRKLGHRPTNKPRTRDPRFDDLCGSKFNEEIFDKRYCFLSRIREKEKSMIMKKMRKTKNSEEKKKMKYLLNRMNNQEREKSRKQEEKEVIGAWMREEKLKVQQGKKPYFLKVAEKKKLIKEHRTQKLRESGELEKVMEKRKKKILMKQKKKLPQARRGSTGGH